MQEQLFRNEVIEAGRNRLTGTVIAAVPPTSRLYTRLVAGAAVLLILIFAFGHYTMTSDVRGIVAYDAGVARVYARTPAEIRAIHVRSGDRVKAGDPLVTLAVTQGQGGIAPQLSELDKREAEIVRQIEIDSIKNSADLAAADKQHAGLEAAIASLRRQRVLAAEQVRLAGLAAKRAKRLAADGAGTQRQVEDSASTLLSRRAEVEALDEQIIAQQNALRASEADRERLRLDGQRSHSVLLAEQASLAEERAVLVRSDRLVLTAPVAGTVGDIGLDIGQRASPDAAIASIIPGGSELEVWLYAPSRAVGSARPGQTVNLQFDAFPYQKYGVGKGIVTEVGRVPVEPANLDPGLQITEPVFRIRTRITAVAPRADASTIRLRPGMTLSGKMLLERQSLWQVILGPVFEAMS